MKCFTLSNTQFTNMDSHSHNFASKHSVIFLFLISLTLTTFTVTSFGLQNVSLKTTATTTQLFVKTIPTPPPPVNISGKGFAQSTKDVIISNASTKQDVDDDSANDDDTEIKARILKMNPTQIKEKLLDLLPRMKGTKEEFKYVEAYINALEDKFIPPQTLDFLNLAMVGEWQFLFTSNQLGRPSPKLRLTELVQKIEVNGFDGKMTNRVSCNT